ncbi:MAG: hypothetical protein ACI94Y_000454 [Maribacter sp.]
MVQNRIIVKWIYKISLFSLAFVGFYSCADPPDYPNEPVLEFLTMSKNFMQQAAIEGDSMTITFSFTDGDGNLGSNLTTESILDVFLYDKRDGFLANQYRIPFIPQQGVGNGISGEITVIAYSSCCITEAFPPCFVTPSVPTDTLIYQIQIMDRDSNFSNIIESDPIILGCN